ncbi:MAG: prepilin peptidase [bacterium]|nr:prepilin peptidase [bacterium]MXZ30913.1 prepilin peptidase [Acidimicrobiia bacterium]MYB24392.1 prepilin peptidase [Acidimicrobiia bacterium]MYJ12855.1 prepilin peptidase [Acidimicrobiia bacterium]
MTRRRIGAAAVALATGAAGALSNIEGALFVAWLAVLSVLSWHDLRTRRIPTAIVNPATAAGLAALAGTAWRSGTPLRLGAAAATAAAAYGTFALLHALNPDGLGYGDVRLVGLLGLFLGWLGPVAMATAALAGAVAAAGAALALSARRRDLKATLPFGPFLAAGAAAVALLHTESPVGFS